MSAPVLRVPAALASGRPRGGLSTRIGFPSADDDEERTRARTRLAGALHVPADRATWMKQVHGGDVVPVDAPGFAGESDALATTRRDLLLLVSVADCCPVLLWSDRAPARAVAHAGWRGVVAGILENSVRALAALGAPPDTLRAWIGPSIGPDRFEVGEEVATQFDERFVRRPEGAPRPFVDLKAAAAARLVDAGIDAARVRICADCTYERDELYWSYRRDGGICGRHLGYLVG